MLKNHKKIKQIKRLFKKNLMGWQMDKRETNSDHETEKKIICKYSLFKECFKKLIIPIDFFCRMKIKNKLVYMVGGRI